MEVYFLKKIYIYINIYLFTIIIVIIIIKIMNIFKHKVIILNILLVIQLEGENILMYIKLDHQSMITLWL